MKITDDIYYIGVNDRKIDLFEGQYKVPEGMSYNSYVVLDEKIAVFDTVEAKFGEEWLNNLNKVLGGRTPDYLIVQHMEPDHSANIASFMEKYPTAEIVGNAKTFKLISQFFGKNYCENLFPVCENDMLCTGTHTFSFVFAPMVHWPEVMMTYDSADKIFFSADAFGKFGDFNSKDNWVDEARRYYIGIVGKYGVQVQSLFKKISELEIKKICPLHGPVLDGDLSRYINLYDIWSRYDVEKDGVMVAYTSVYGHTKQAAGEIASYIKNNGQAVEIFDLARCDMSEAVAAAFSYGKIVLATTTYNNCIFPFMAEFISHLTERNFSNRTVGIIENGSWAPQAAKIIKGAFEKSKDVSFAETTVTIKSAPDGETSSELKKLADEISGK